MDKHEPRWSRWLDAFMNALGIITMITLVIYLSGHTLFFIATQYFGK